jgi:hypothetical protein
LVEAVGKGALGLLDFPLEEGGGNSSGVAQIGDGILKGDAGGEERASGASGGLNSRDGCDKLQARGYLGACWFTSSTDDKAAKSGCRNIVGMSFQGGGGLDEPRKIEITAIEFIESGEHPEADGGTASEAAGWRDSPTDDEAVGFGAKASGFVVGVDNFGGKGVGNIWEARFDCDVVIEIEGEAEGIEAWTEVGGGGWDADPKRQMEVG